MHLKELSNESSNYSSPLIKPDAHYTPQPESWEALGFKDSDDYTEWQIKATVDDLVEVYHDHPYEFATDFCYTLNVEENAYQLLPRDKPHIKDNFKVYHRLPKGCIYTLCSSREMQKSASAACFIVHQLGMTTNNHGVWSSINEDHAIYILEEYIESILKQLPIPYPSWRKTGNQIVVEDLGNSITAVARGATQITGHHLSYWFADEYSKIEPHKEQVRVYREGTPALRYGKVFILSTPVAETYFEFLMTGRKIDDRS